MRVLVVDQDSASNEAIARSLRDLFTVDAVTNKADCLDLLRSNTFEAIVATERLEDGSGLELLGQIGKKWPEVLRIFAADRERLKLLRGRLGPFELFQTLSYPIDPDRLIATLNLAEAAQGANADTSSIQHVELRGDVPAFEEGGPERSDESAESGEFPAPQPLPRAVSAGQAVQASRGVRTAASYRVGSNSSQTSRRGGAAPNSASRVGAASTAQVRSTTPAPPLPAATGRPLRSRVRGPSNRPPPVRFPPLERVPPLEPPRDSRSNTSGDSFAEAAAMARAARSNFEPPADGTDTTQLAVRVGAGAMAVVVVVWLGFKIFGSKTESPPAPRPAVQAPQYSREVTELVAKIETSLQADDFNAVRADVDKLRELAPSHPRLAFFEGILLQRAERGKNGSSTVARGTVKRAGSSPRGGSGTPTDDKAHAGAGGKVAATSAGAGRVSGGVGNGSPSRLASDSRSGTSSSTAAGSSPSHVAPTSASLSRTALSGGAASRSAAGPGSNSGAGSATSDRTSVTGSTPRAGESDDSLGSDGPVLPPETPPGLTRPSAPSGTSSATPSTSTLGPSSDASGAGASASAASATSSPTPSGSANLSASGADSSPAARISTSGQTSSSSGSAHRNASSEPPPVVREARLIRRVEPDYPSAAKREGIKGFVDLEVTISATGVVEDVSVIQATPAEVFDKAAVTAVRKWKYDPRFVDGLPSEAHLKVHLEFAPR